MKKRCKIIGICIISITLVIMAIYSISSYIYDINIYSDWNSYKQGLQIIKIIEIKESNISNIEKLNFKNINFKNNFSNFELSVSNDKAIEYVLKDETGNKREIFTILLNDTYINTIINGDLSFASGTLQNLNRNKILKENSITNDIELIKKIVENKEKQINFFDSLSKKKEIFLFKDVALEIFPILQNIELIEGKFTGYIFNVNDTMTIINILKDDIRYTFQFFGTEINDQYIYDFLNNLEIN